MMDAIREREANELREQKRVQSLTPEQREIERQEQIKKNKQLKMKKYDQFSFMNDSSDTTYIANVYKTNSENDENIERKKKEFAKNDEKTVFMKEWCKNNKNNNFCICPSSDLKKYDQEEWKKKCDLSLTQDSSLVDKYNYLCSNKYKCNSKNSDCKTLQNSCKQLTKEDDELKLIPKSYITDPFTQKVMRIFSYKGEQDGFVLHRVIDTEKYIQQIQYFKDYIAQLKDIQNVLQQWKFDYKKKIYEQLNDFKDELQNKIDELEQLLNPTTLENTVTTTTTNNETLTNNSTNMSFGKKHHSNNNSPFRFYQQKRHHRRNRHFY